MFNQLDRDGDGKLSKSDLTTVATFEKLTPEEIDEVFKEVQPMVQPEDGTISFEEFSKAINVRDASALLRRLARSRPLERHVPAGPACVVGVDCQGSARPQPLLQGGGRHAPPGRRACTEHALRRRHVRRGAQGSQRVHDPLRSGHGGAHAPPPRPRALRKLSLLPATPSSLTHVCRTRSARDGSRSPGTSRSISAAGARSARTACCRATYADLWLKPQYYLVAE